MTGKKILIIGSLNVDMTVNVPHTPSAGETIIASKMEMIPGGKGANQACAAGRLGADAAILGAVGDDSYGKIELGSLSRSGVDISHIVVKTEAATGMAFITVNQDGDNCIVVVSGANGMLSPEDIDNHAELLKECEIVIFQLEIPLETVCYAAKLAKAFGKIVILDPAPVPEVFPEELYQYVDIIKPNETELSMLTGMDTCGENLPRAVEKLKERGVKDVLVTLGEKGVYLDAQTCGVCRIPAHRVTAVDTTAAGDSFTAALAFMLAQGKDIREAAEFANCVSAIVVTKKGAQSSIPTLEEVRRFYLECEN